MTYRVFNIGVPVGDAPSFASTDTNTTAAYLIDPAHVKHEKVAITGPHRGWVCIGICVCVVRLQALDGRASAAVVGGGRRPRPILRPAHLRRTIRATARLVRLLLVLARQIRTCGIKHYSLLAPPFLWKGNVKHQQPSQQECIAGSVQQGMA